MWIVLKIAGSTLIVLSSSMLGFYYSNKDNFRVNALEELKKALVILKSQIEHSMTPLPEAMMLISERTGKNLGSFFEYTANSLNKRGGEGINAIWLEALDCSLKKTYLAEEDIDYLKTLGNSLGYLDVKLQINSIQIIIEYIDSKVQFLHSISEKNKKMYSSLGILGGILVTVIFI